VEELGVLPVVGRVRDRVELNDAAGPGGRLLGHDLDAVVNGVPGPVVRGYVAREAGHRVHHAAAALAYRDLGEEGPGVDDRLVNPEALAVAGDEARARRVGEVAEGRAREEGRDPGDVAEGRYLRGVDARELGDAAALGEGPDRVHPPEDEFAAEARRRHRVLVDPELGPRALVRGRGRLAGREVRDVVVGGRQEEREHRMAGYVVHAEAMTRGSARVADAQHLDQDRQERGSRSKLAPSSRCAPPTTPPPPPPPQCHTRTPHRELRQAYLRELGLVGEGQLPEVQGAVGVLGNHGDHGARVGQHVVDVVAAGALLGLARRAVLRLTDVAGLLLGPVLDELHQLLARPGRQGRLLLVLLD
jgi:hypothetical protein